ncbi:adhesion G protein-coupled receptor E1 isoform X5 [Tachysurus vachellii]|uniref:adhesion G protein-coupled receptor E1 isoform X5 n=1 Tax=Tachysurus vachellii TaxID=175792 RepID=UPI00296B1E27|nr:adhesion G protein-coupled receptor E1 isoform X5 [Tachysurus vachellii]
MWRLMFLALLLVVQTSVTASVTCGPGYAQDRGVCEDYDECEEEEGLCRNNAVCYNTIGSYYCQCEQGYRAKLFNFTEDKGGTCKDINECTENKSICGPNAVCDNIPGSYQCSCATGFVASNGQKHFNARQNVTCNDINECTENKSICGPNAVCDNIPGSYQCSCATGFVASNGQKHFNARQNVTCDDIDECSEENICVLNAKCINTNGSYFCTCHPGFVASNMEEKFTTREVRCNELQCDRLGRQSEEVPQVLQDILAELKSTCMQKNANGEQMLQILVDALEVYLSETSLTDAKNITSVLDLVENTLPVVGQLLHSSYNQSSSQTRVEMLVHRNPTPPHGPFNLSTNKVQFSSDWETAVGDSYLGFASASLFEYTDLNIPHVKSLIGNQYHGPNISANPYQLNSRVVTIEVTNQNTTKLTKPVTLRFSHLKDLKGKVACVFWDSKKEGGVWSSEGCDVVKNSTSYTVCSCKHLSSFAVLLALYEQKNVFELQLITWIGLGLSLICLLICILTFWLIRSIQSTRTTIHLHLCISLFIADFIFLVGISQTDNRVGCGVVAGLLHYFFLAVFCWMCLEGVQLFRMVVLVFNTTLSRGYLMAAGYGAPAIIVILSACVNYKGYGTPSYCWLNLENGFIWSFFGPVCAIIIVNAAFFMITVWKLAQKFNSLNPDLGNLKKIKTFTITAIAQLCVLGTMWIFGCFQFDEGTLVMSYLFTIFNSLQGVLVFIMHCLLSKQVRDEYIRFLTCLTARQKSSYSEFSTNQSSKSQVSKNSHNTGESRI